MRANNGERAEVKFGAVETRAGVRRDGDLLVLAFAAPLIEMRMIREGLVDGKPATVVSWAQEPFNPRKMVQATVRLDPPAEA